jgi:hypothetical protein
MSAARAGFPAALNGFSTAKEEVFDETNMKGNSC